MFLSLPCSGCQRQLRVGAAALGRRVRCPGCGARLVIDARQPAPTPAPPEAPSSPAPAPGPAACLVEFQARVCAGTGSAARWRGRACGDGLHLYQGADLVGVVPVGAPGGARYLGANRVLLTVEGRPVEVAVRRWGQPQAGLACDLAAHLNGARAALRPGRYAVPWLLLAALLPLGLPVLLGGVGWALLGAALALLAAGALGRERWPLALRRGLVLGLAGLGYAAALAPWLAGAFLPAPADVASQEAPAAAGPEERRPWPREGRRGFRGGWWPGRRRPWPGPDGAPGPLPAAPVPERLAAGNELPPGSRSTLPEARGLLTLTVAPRSGTAFATTADGSLLQYAYPEWNFVARHRLPLPAYQAALDEGRGRLYVASSAPEALAFGPLGDREPARGDLHVYDVRPLLEGAGAAWRGRAGTSLAPVRAHELDADVLSLQLSPDGEWLYYLASSPQGSPLGRLHAPSWTAPAGGTFPMRAGAAGLCLAPDGKALYLSRPGRALVFSGDLWRSDDLAAPAAASMAADRAGRLFLAEEGRGEQGGGTVTVLDTQRQVTLARWSVALPGRLFLCLSPDGQRLYLSNSCVAGNAVLCLLVGGERAVAPALVGVAETSRDAPLGGPSFLSPDGRSLVNRAGALFRLAGPSGP
jgi:hypothetical protein